jgi:DHA1 family multidrug resistance protein-like MFS transporter
MFSTFFRDSFVGRMLYHLSGHKIATHKEEKPGYVVLEKYLTGDLAASNRQDSVASSDSLTIPAEETEKKELADGEVDDNGHPFGFETQEEIDEEVAHDVKDHGYIIVDWDGEDDPDNPYNWPLKSKIFFMLEIAFLTTSVYMASAIYTPGIEEIMHTLNVSQTVAILPLTLFVVGYGLGPLVFSPLSENAIFGRTSLYVVTLFIFFILQIPTALSTNIAGLCILRFISGFFASPCLATGGASIADVVGIPYIPVGIATWAMGAICGPTIGPLIGAAVTVGGGWRWTFWFMAIISGFSLLINCFLLPETFSKTLLRRKAQRLRALTGNDKLRSEGEIENEHLSVKEMLFEALWRPISISLVEPVVLLINIYISLVYSIMYLWFEAFPIVFLQTKHFTLVTMGVAYTSLMVGIIGGALVYIAIVRQLFTVKLLKGLPVFPEVFIPMAIVGAVLMPVGIFLFSWTASPDIHWIGPLFGAGIYACGAFFIFQTLFNYMSMSFQHIYLASVFASNAFWRSTIAGVFPLFAHALFTNTGSERFPVGWGSSILGFITVGMIAIPVLFYINGPKLRARSKFANHY